MWMSCKTSYKELHPSTTIEEKENIWIEIIWSQLKVVVQGVFLEQGIDKN